MSINKGLPTLRASGRRAQSDECICQSARAASPERIRALHQLQTGGRAARANRVNERRDATATTDCSSQQSGDWRGRDTETTTETETESLEKPLSSVWRLRPASRCLSTSAQHNESSMSQSLSRNLVAQRSSRAPCPTTNSLLCRTSGCGCRWARVESSRVSGGA